MLVRCRSGMPCRKYGSDTGNDGVAPDRRLAFPACHRRPDHRRDDRRGFQAAQCGGGEERDQRRPHPRGLESQARQTGPEGPRRARDGQVHQGQARRRWRKARRSRDPPFGYKNHIGIDRTHGLIRTWRATHAARHDGAQLPDLIDKQKPPATCGPIPLTARRRTKSIWSGTDCAARSIARSRRASRCRRPSQEPTDQRTGSAEKSFTICVATFSWNSRPREACASVTPRSRTSQPPRS